MSQSTYQTLIDIGIDADKAREAAKRYDDRVEAAVDWCFGPGAEWTAPTAVPAAAMPIAAPASSGMHFSHLEHHEVKSPHRSPAPPLPPRRSPLFAHKPLASNNPFRDVVQPDLSEVSSPLSTPPPPAAWDLGSVSHIRTDAGTSDEAMQDDHDAELARAIMMSQEQHSAGPGQASGGAEHAGVDNASRVSVMPAEDIEMAEADGESEQRADRERSMRATAPPPSPREGDSALPAYGPSTRNETGQTAMVPFTSANNDISKDDEDLNRAIEASLMTASMNSLPPIDQPIKLPRQDGAPLVFYSESNRSTYAANFLQALHAVPQLRRTVMESVVDGITPFKLAVPMGDLARLFKLAESDEESYENVDEILKDLRDGPERNQLPPKLVLQSFIDVVAEACESLAANTVDRRPDIKGEPWSDPSLLTYTLTDPPIPKKPAYVSLERQGHLASNLHAHLADILWWQSVDAQGDAAPSSIGHGKPTSLTALPDMLCVVLDWGAGAKRELWELEEEIVLDRYMKENQVWTTHLRAQRSVAQGAARRLKEKIEALTMYKGYDYQESLARLIAHYDKDTTSADDIRKEMRGELKAKLSQTLSALQRKTEELKADLNVEEEMAGGMLFETDDPEKNKQVYTLRAALMHDGALVQGRHLYAYIKGDDGRWWKIQDHEVNPTTFAEISTDRTGLFMDGGPYCLVYGRRGPRPVPRTSEDADRTTEAQPHAADDSISIDSATGHITPFPLAETTTVSAGAAGGNAVEETVSVDTAVKAPPPDTSPAVQETSLIDLDSDEDKGVKDP